MEVARPREGVRAGAGAGDVGDVGRSQRILGWSLAGAGGVFLAGGVTALLVRTGIVSDYNAECPGVGASLQPSDCGHKIDASRTWETISIVSLAAGGAFAAGGIVVALTAPRPRGAKAEKMRSPEHAWICGVSPGGAGCAGRFSFF